MFRRSSIAGLVAIVMGATLVVGPQAGARVAAAKVDTKAILKVGLNFRDKTTFPFDPALRSSNRSSIPVGEAIYDTLVRQDPVTGKLTPGLALSWDAPDPLTINVKLRQGVKFHDGTPFNADAVKFSIDRFTAAVKSRAAVTPDANYVNVLTSVDVVGPYEVRLKLSQPLTGLFVNEIFPFADSFGIVSPTAVAKWGADYKNHPVGAGPFVFELFTEDQQLTVRKFADYWDKKSYQYQGVDFINVRAGNDSVTALRSGRVDIGILDTASAAAMKNASGYKTLEQQSSSLYQMTLPLCVAPFNNPKVAQAIKLAINRDEVIGALGAGAPTPLPFGVDSKYYDEKIAKNVSYNLKKAKSLLQGLGPFSQQTLMVKNNPSDQQVATVVKSQLEAIGIPVTIFVTPDATNDLVRLKPMYLALSTLQVVSQYTQKGGGANLHCNYDNPTAATAWNSALRDSSLSEAERKKAFTQAEQILTEEGPMIWIAQAPFFAGYTTAVKGFTRMNSIDQAGPVLRTLYKQPGK